MSANSCPYCGFENIAGSDRCGKCTHSLSLKDLPSPGKDAFQKKIMTQPCGDFISKKVPPIIVKASTPISEVIAKMHEFPMKGCVLICDEKGILAGITSIRDILLKVAGLIDDTYSVSIDKIMTSKPETVDKNDPLSFALHKMHIGKFRHVPVIDQGRPIGVVSTRDLIEHLASN